MPHVAAALLMAATMALLSESRSLKVRSRLYLPSSLRMVVCASCVTAQMGSDTPYEAACASTTRTYSTPSMVMVTLSRVMADCEGMDSAVSLSECT